jgi:hypothetical protein
VLGDGAPLAVRPASHVTAESAAFPAGAALVARPATGSVDGLTQGWVLVDGEPPAVARSLGAILAWAHRQEIDELHVVADDAGVLARRALLFADPPTVWTVDGAELVPAVPAAVPEIQMPPADALDLVSFLSDAGVEIVIEHGDVRGEILGLEVARIVVDDQGPRIEVGVGRHDREAFTMVHGNIPTADALAVVLASVRSMRGPGLEAGKYPLGRMAAERWLRRAVIAEPSLVGAVDLVPAEPVLPRDSLNDVAPAVAVGTTTDGRPLVVVTSTGIDLDLVPAAADARQLHAPGARLVLVVPERDNHSVTQHLAGALAQAADVVAVRGDFRERVEVG